MINLLNPEQVAELRSARLNFRLRRYIYLAVFAAIGVVAIYGLGYWIADKEHSQARSQNEIAKSELKNYEGVKSRIADYRANLVIADKILGTQIVYSDFLVNTAQAMPQDTILANLSLDSKAQANPATKGLMTIEARTKSYDDALRLKESLEASPLFSDVRLQQVSTPETPAVQGVAKDYPFHATYSVKLEKNSGAKT